MLGIKAAAAVEVELKIRNIYAGTEGESARSMKYIIVCLVCLCAIECIFIKCICVYLAVRSLSPSARRVCNSSAVCWLYSRDIITYINIHVIGVERNVPHTSSIFNCLFIFCFPLFRGRPLQLRRN